MKVIANLILYLLVGIIISACGTGQYLGFEKKKVPLKGKRVSILKDVCRQLSTWGQGFGQY